MGILIYLIQEEAQILQSLILFRKLIYTTKIGKYQTDNLLCVSYWNRHFRILRPWTGLYLCLTMVILWWSFFFLGESFSLPNPLRFCLTHAFAVQGFILTSFRKSKIQIDLFSSFLFGIQVSYLFTFFMTRFEEFMTLWYFLEYWRLFLWAGLCWGSSCVLPCITSWGEQK